MLNKLKVVLLPLVKLGKPYINKYVNEKVRPAVRTELKMVLNKLKLKSQEIDSVQDAVINKLEDVIGKI